MITDFKVGQRWTASHHWMNRHDTNAEVKTDMVEITKVGRTKVQARIVRNGKLIAPVLTVNAETLYAKCDSGAVDVLLAKKDRQ